MNRCSTEAERIKTVEKWEAMKTDKLSALFEHYLYRIRNWSKGYSARYFTKDDTGVFKGISPDVNKYYPFEKIFRIAQAHYYKKDYNYTFPFQADQTIINGKQFFEMVAYYNEMINEIENMSDEKNILKTIKNYEGCHRKGDKFVRNLFYCGLIYYKDKFGDESFSKALAKIFVWAYSLRLQMTAVQLASIDNYALDNIQLFKTIREAVHPDEILNIKLDSLKKNESTKTEDIEELFIEMGYYERST